MKSSGFGDNSLEYQAKERRLHALELALRHLSGCSYSFSINEVLRLAKAYDWRKNLTSSESADICLSKS
jgi:hypothetical protein